MCLLRDLQSQLAEAHLRIGTEQRVGRHRNGREYRFPILGGQVLARARERILERSGKFKCWAARARIAVSSERMWFW